MYICLSVHYNHSPTESVKYQDIYLSKLLFEDIASKLSISPLKCQRNVNTNTPIVPLDGEEDQTSLFEICPEINKTVSKKKNEMEK